MNVILNKDKLTKLSDNIIKSFIPNDKNGVMKANNRLIDFINDARPFTESIYVKGDEVVVDFNAIKKITKDINYAMEYEVFPPKQLERLKNDVKKIYAEILKYELETEKFLTEKDICDIYGKSVLLLNNQYIIAPSVEQIKNKNSLDVTKYIDEANIEKALANNIKIINANTEIDNYNDDFKTGLDNICFGYHDFEEER